MHPQLQCIALALAAIGLLPAAAGEPALQWTFDSPDEPGQWQGKAKPSEQTGAGPRGPRYPDFGDENQAAFFPGADALLLVKDKDNGGSANLKFGAGESITIEAWVKVKSIGNGHMTYLVGKGRHAGKGAVTEQADANQNYAMRLKGIEGGAQLGFLFTSEHPESKKRDWHRWWSNRTIAKAGWNHVAVVFTFGKANSFRAYINGKATDGVWDLGGATDLPPTTDADDLVIGTGYSRSGGSSFSGWMDNLQIHREALAPEILLSRYEYTPPPPPITPEMVQPGEVLVQISERGVPEANAWPEEPEVTETYREKVFGFFESPQKYISTGVRADRANPSHFRAAAKVTFPKGKHRLLLRGRGAARLTIDGQQLLENPFPPAASDGHELVSLQDGYLDLGPDFRFVPPGNRESWCEFETDGGEHFVIVETMVGAMKGTRKRRPELGETVVAISLAGEESWKLLSPGDREVAYTDEGWEAYEKERRNWLARVNGDARAAKRAEHAKFWDRRRKAASDWLANSTPVTVPDLPAGLPANNEIDHFIGARIAEAAAQAKSAKGGTVDYFKHIQPLLESKCYNCHQGGKVKGGLRLDQRAAALKGGENDGPAVAASDLDGSSLIFRVSKEAEDDIMPPKGDPLAKEEVALLKTWIEEGAHWPEFDVDTFEVTPLASDLAFLRRVSLDTIGIPPTEAEIAAFLAADAKTRRAEVIQQLLDDPRWADHWMGYWQDVLAENPNMINPTLNNTGPFRWWIQESLLDNKPLDLFVTELIRMEGSERFGGPRGFGTASQNDVPMAAKGIIVTSAFLGVEMKCARCHDAPGHEWMQEDLFQVAAMLNQNSLKVPTTSSVPMDKLHARARKPLIEVTLKPGSVVQPGWPFEQFCDEATAATLVDRTGDSRDKLAALITAPQNERFAQVMANRIWHRLMGRGIVATVADWEKGEATHPELLRWLGRRLVESGYDVKAVTSLILNSHAYQRATDPTLTETGPLYIAPAPRRLSAEQIVDSLFSATGKPFELEDVSLDIDSTRDTGNSLALGKPRRAWMLASMSNERDRPSLALPRIQAVSSVMESFGWRGARQDPVTIRDVEPNVLQPAIYANGVMGSWLTRLSDDHGVTQLALEDQSLEALVDRLFLRLLTRHPIEAEKARYVGFLRPGYDARIIPEAERPSSAGEDEPRVPARYVSWSNHVNPEANVIALEREIEARRGDPPTAALNNNWRLRLEDVLWALINAPEFVYVGGTSVPQ
ncbi:MAG: hypothetical protein ACI8UO_003396 [Verrucomicrobiales bacterium]|jgi:hypothetical protein